MKIYLSNYLQNKQLIISMTTYYKQVIAPPAICHYQLIGLEYDL